MRIREVLISETIARKIWQKHKVLPEETEDLLFSNPLVRRARDGRYMAIGLASRGYLTVIFEYTKGLAVVITAYPAADWQVRMYKKAKRW